MGREIKLKNIARNYALEKRSIENWWVEVQKVL